MFTKTVFFLILIAYPRRLKHKLAFIQQKVKDPKFLKNYLCKKALGSNVILITNMLYDNKN